MFQVKTKKGGKIAPGHQSKDSIVQAISNDNNGEFRRQSTRVVSKDVEDAAWNAIDKRMDIVTLVKELTALRFIVNTLLSER